MRNAMRIAAKIRLPVKSIPIPAILFAFLLLLIPSAARADEMIEVRVEGHPPLPPPIKSELIDIFTDTLTDVLFDGEISPDRMSLDTEEIADAIRTGANILIEPRGYSVTDLTLDFDRTPVLAVFEVHPVGWTIDDPAAVTDVQIELVPDGLAQFWMEKLGQRIADNRDELIDTYELYLLGLPVYASDRQWALDIVMPELVRNDPAPALCRGYSVEREVELGPVATVKIHLIPVDDLIELIRPRMYSQTLYNIILDRLRERLLAEADILEGMPKEEINGAEGEIARYLQERLAQDPLVNQFDAYVSIEMATIPMEPVVRIDVTVESRSYHLWLETFIDFGNESRDSAEIQSRFGVLLARGVEIFANLNYFTNDNTLETDLAFGLRPTRGTFAAVGYDLEREAMKYFLEQQLDPGLMVRGEIFEDDELNEFGVTYQFQQYLSGGVFTNGDNEYWVRAIFTL